MELSTELVKVAKENGKLELLGEIQTWVLAKGADFTPKELVEFLDEKFEEML